MLAWTGAVVVALVTAHIVASDLASLHRRARSAGEEVEVLVAARDLVLGTRLQRGDLRVEHHFERRLPPDAVRRRTQAVGRTVSTPVLEGSIVSDRHLADPDRDGLDGVVPEGMRAVRVVAESGVKPEPGSLVDVLVTLDPSVVNQGDPTTAAVRGALVLSSDELGSAELGDERIGVTVLTDPEGARRLAFAAAHGFVTISLAPPEVASGDGVER